jgi:hypothetical protein
VRMIAIVYHAPKENVKAFLALAARRTRHFPCQQNVSLVEFFTFILRLQSGGKPYF